MQGEGAISQSPGTGISLPVLSELPQFPAAPPMCLPSSPPSLPHGCLPCSHTAGAKASLAEKHLAESWKGALQREEKAKMGGTKAGRNMQQHDRDRGSGVAGLGQVRPPCWAGARAARPAGA